MYSLLPVCQTGLIGFTKALATTYLPALSSYEAASYVTGGYALKWFASKAKTVWDITNILEGKNLEKYQKDAPQSLRMLLESLQAAEIKPEKARGLIEKGLANFFSTPGHEKCIKCSLSSWEFRRAPFLNPLRNLYDNVQSCSRNELDRRLSSCIKIIKSQIAKQQGMITKAQEAAKDLLVKGATAMVSSPKDEFRPGMGIDHPLVKIRYLLNQWSSARQKRLLEIQFEKLGNKDLNPDNLNQFLREEVLMYNKFDPIGIGQVCDDLNVNIADCFEGKVETLDRVFITYKQLRDTEPRIPPHPPELAWNKATTLEREKARALDLISSFGVYIFFKQVHGGDDETLQGFYTVLAETQSLQPKERKQKIFEFFGKERKRLGGSMTPWIMQKQVIDFIYCTVKRTVYNFCSETPLFETIGEHLKTAPASSMTFAGSKMGRYFHTLAEDHAQWAKEHAFDMEAEPYLKEKLYERQDDATDRLNIDSFVSSYNLVSTTDSCRKWLAKWSDIKPFAKDGRFAVFNSPLVSVKNLLTIVPRIALGIVRIPLLLLEKVLDAVYQKVVEQVLIHTSIVDKVEEVVTDAFLTPSPTHFPVLEVVLKYLQSFSEIIESETLTPSDIPDGSDQAKRALVDGVKQLVTFANTQDSTTTNDQSHETALFETLLPFGIDKLYNSFLKVHKVYANREDESDQLKDLFQAFNSVAYNNKDSFLKEELPLLEARYKEVNRQIGFYLRKILITFLVQTSKEELSPEIGEKIESLLTQVRSEEYSTLVQNYIERKSGLFRDLISKPYILKGLLLFFITRDKESTEEE